MNNNIVIDFYNAIRTKWPGTTVEWHQLDPQRQMMLIQAINLTIQAMQ